jgi:integrase
MKIPQNIPEEAKNGTMSRRIEQTQRTGSARKYPECQFSWGWAWLFPAHFTCRDPITGTIVRYRMHEANVQRAVRHARRKLSISVLPHELRHGYATHCLEQGTNPRAIQQVKIQKS